VAEVPNIAVAAVNIFLVLLDRNVVFLRVGDGVFAGVDIPLAPRGDDLDVGRDGFVSQFERPSAPSCNAISAWRLAMTGRAMEVPSK
jgi:hypothetical protein